ncbi:hypothetical protein [Candidatus Laterigemmans baculatus]|uniref:hypothetical protein n=1 Tax=Candidatus Laterigemmans baculatus TaxID=2770505 RepID=UPI0013DD0D66|nr:hypothetical protein [Candidatus Laterigemmans baculatus]
MADSHSQASQPRRGIVAIVLSMLQIGVLSAGLVVPLPMVFASTGAQAASEDHHETGISVCEQKRSRTRAFVVARYLVVVPPQTHILRQRIAADSHSRVRWRDGHRYDNGLLAPLRC